MFLGKRFKLYDNSFRIKTEKEFIKEYGNGWRRIVAATFTIYMDMFLGLHLKDISRNYHFTTSYNTGRHFSLHCDHKTFVISCDMLKRSKKLFSKHLKRRRLCVK